MNPTTNEPITDNRLHIVFAIEQLHAMSGGAERVMADVTKGLSQRGHRITILTYEGFNGPSFYPINFGVERLDARPRHSRRKGKSMPGSIANLGTRSLILSMPIWFLQNYLKFYRIRRALKTINADVAVGFMPTMFPYIVFSSLGLRTKSVASIHNVPVKEFGSDPKRWNQNRFDIIVRRRSLRLADAVTVLLPGFRKQFKSEKIRKKLHVIPNMVAAAQPPYADVASDRSGNVILAVGRLSDAKDHKTLIEAWALIEHKYPDWKVKIFGSGPLKNSLTRRIRLLDLKNLEILDPVADINSQYRAAKIFAMPSKYEGFGLVTVEALSMGLPVIGFSSCPGTNELVKHMHSGLLVSSNGAKTKKYAEALSKVIEDEPLREELARNAIHSVSEYSEDRIITKWESLLISMHKNEASNV